MHEWIKMFEQPQVSDVSTATNSELSARIRQLERAMAEKDATIAVLRKAISIINLEKPSGSP
ncbi:MAG: hypothetical protein ABI690_12985 [Chloroflexota bacterium]